MQSDIFLGILTRSYGRLLRVFMTGKVVILGASNNPNRFTFKAFGLLKQYGHIVFPVSPNLKSIDSTEVYSDLEQILQPILKLSPSMSDSI